MGKWPRLSKAIKIPFGKTIRPPGNSKFYNLYVVFLVGLSTKNRISGMLCAHIEAKLAVYGQLIAC